MTCFFNLPNEILIIILSHLDPFNDFTQLVNIPHFKPLINTYLCVLTDDLTIRRTNPFSNIIHIGSYKDVIIPSISSRNFQYFIIDIHTPNGEGFISKCINTLVLYKKLHVINFHCDSLPDAVFNQGLFSGNEFTRDINVYNIHELGNAQISQLFHDTCTNFKINSEEMISLYANFGHKKSYLKNFNLPNLINLQVTSSHLSSNCIKNFTKLINLEINSYSDLEDLTLNHLAKIKLSAGYSLMLSNCCFNNLKQIEIDPDARFPGLINCQLNSLIEFDIKTTNTSYIKDLICPNLESLNLVHTMKGTLNTLVFEGGYFPKLSSLVVPSSIYLLHFTKSSSSIEKLTIFIQKKWFYPTLPMNLLQFDDDDDNNIMDEYNGLSIMDEMELITQVVFQNLKSLTIIIENIPVPKIDDDVDDVDDDVPTPEIIIKIPNLLRTMPQLNDLTLLVSINDDFDKDNIMFDLSFLQENILNHFKTNINETCLIGYHAYQIRNFYHVD